ncbi:phage tail assembly protein [Streptobacillus moniliformis]|uniref:phage tail assembly protein n=1 Tax=Streptobacillus moniliformis TaxID=34105 RepID=UPI0007E38691|nr:phage tail assembly protein [Streptobacillus moniliformis]QXW65660.1 phage tail assembly protein [Streptobacillus moniliformis]
MIIKLSREYNFSGKTFNEFELDFDILTGKDMIALEKEYKLRNKGSIIKELEDGWALTVAARLIDVKYGDLLNLNANDYLRLINSVKTFLNKTLEVTEEKESMEETEE